MKNLFMGLALAIVGSVSIARAQQCPYNAGQPTRETCTIVNGQKVYTDPNTGIQYTSVPSGTGTFSTLNNGANPCFQNFRATALTTTSVDPVLGLITTTLDGTRVPTVSTVRALGQAPFPAVEDLFIPIRVTIANQPGRVLTSIGEVHLQGIINSWPQKNERVTLVAPVALEDRNNPGVVVYNITNLSIQF
jgi:hypothetical protein